MKEYANRRRQSNQTTMTIGNFVLVRHQKIYKFQKEFLPQSPTHYCRHTFFQDNKKRIIFKLMHTTPTLSQDDKKMEDGDEEQQDIESNQDKNNLNRDQQPIIERQYPRKAQRRANYYN